MLLVSTVRRRCPANATSGFIYAIDLQNQRILKRCSIIETPYREVDTNPRGGMRGSKGIAVRNDQIALSNDSMICRYDPQWNLLGVITHPSCAGIHDILFEGDTLWVSSARNDMVMQFDISGELLRHFYMREPSPATDVLKWKPPVLLGGDQIREGVIDFRDPRTHEKETYDRAHVNSICVLQNSEVLVSLGFVFGGDFATLLRLKKQLVKWGVWRGFVAVNRRMRNTFEKNSKTMDDNLIIKPAKAQSAVVRISSDGTRSLCFVLPNVTAPSHSLHTLPDGTIIYLSTTNGSVLHIDPRSGDILSSTKVTDGFLRGITSLNDRTLLLGTRGELLTYDLSAKRVEKRMKIPTDLNESVYDIKRLPSHYSMPPLSFEEHFKKTVGYEAKNLILNNKNSVIHNK